MSLLIHPEAFVIQPDPDFLNTHPHLRRACADLARVYARHEFVADESLSRLGQMLWDALGVSDAFDERVAQRSGHILPVIIESCDAAVHQVPWEILHHPTHGFLGRSPQFTLQRRKAVAAQTTPPPQRSLEKGPLRVALFTSLPDDLHAERSRLDVEEMQTRFLEALTPAITEGLVQYKIPDDGRFSALKDVLKNFQPHVLFLFGHGKFIQPQPHETEKEAYAIFQFESETGSSDLVRGKTLAEAMVGLPLECVVLSACESGMTAPSEELNIGLTWRLCSVGIPHVIGMRESVLERAGILFSHTLCQSLMRQEPVDVAIQRAREAITTPLKDSIWLQDYSSGTAEQSLGQWCLPMLISQDHGRPLLDWQFERQPPKEILLNETLQSVTLPARFLGRRSELRTIKNRLDKGTLPRLLITGPGGQGKTSLAGRLAQDLQKDGYEILAFTARTDDLDGAWDLFVEKCIFLLESQAIEKYNLLEPRAKTEERKTELLLGLLVQQFQGKLVLFLDNLETVQDPQTHEVTHETTKAWLQAGEHYSKQGLVLLVTSRWRLPGWSESLEEDARSGIAFAGDHWPLSSTSYGDFLRMGLELVSQGKLAKEFLRNRERMRKVYQTLHGNARGLEFFASAMKGMSEQEEEAFLQTLKDVEAEVQTDMALAHIIDHLGEEAKALLYRLPAYHTPVPIEGILKLGIDLPSPKGLLQELLDVSLVERTLAPAWDVVEYQLSPLVSEWLAREKAVGVEGALLETAAEYLLYLLEQERRTLPHGILVHQALHRANQTEQAHQLALDWVVGPLQRAGLYRTLLEEWLPPICDSKDRKIQATGLNLTGMQHLHLGEYDKALSHLQQALTIQQEIGDRSGEGSVLNNISQIYDARGEYDKALSYLQQSLAISREIGDRSQEGITLNNMAGIARARGEYDKALEYLEQSLTIRQEIDDRSGESTTLNNISQIYDARGEDDKALSFLQQSLAISREIGDKKHEGGFLNNISQFYKTRGEYDKALEYLKQSLTIFQEIGDKKGEGTTLNNISQFYKDREEYDKAFSPLQQSLAIFQEIGDKKGEGTTLNNMAGIARARGEYDKALSYLQQSLAISQEIGDVAGMSVTLFNIGHIHTQQKDVRQAMSAWLNSYILAERIGLASVLQELGNLAPKLGLPPGLDGWEMLTQQMKQAVEGED